MFANVFEKGQSQQASNDTEHDIHVDTIGYTEIDIGFIVPQSLAGSGFTGNLAARGSRS